MRHGLFFPAFDVLSEPRPVADLAALAESAGWDGVFLWDHMLYSPPVRQIADPWITLAAVAMSTSRIQIGVMVTPLSRRRPAVLARQAVTLDRLSAGRLTLGFGLGDDGGRTRELSRLGEEADPRLRAGMLDEGLSVLTRLLSGDLVTHTGRHFVADGVRFLPTPVRPEGVPIWIAACWPNRAPMRRAASYDGVFVIQLSEPGDVQQIRDVIAERRDSLDGFDLVVQGTPEDDPAPWAAAGATWFLTQLGPYDMDLDAVRAVIEAGPRSGEVTG
jgi:alkanesulfonate monooxygenase SsuD/methylene tetrahydromethanopterin reductase-like flavin-dependent oxidoreductase (luciferase family)